MIINQKFIIIVCQELAPHIGSGIIKKIPDNLRPQYGFDAFPEFSGGSKFVRELMAQHVEIGRPMIIVTRYSDALLAFGLMIYEKKVSHEDVIVVLVNDETGDSSYHRFDAEGVLESSWPIGVLD